MTMISKRAIAGAIAAVSILGAAQGFACTRVLWNEGGPAILVGTNDGLAGIDGTDPHRAPARPQARRRQARREEPQRPHPMLWTSKYGSLVTTVYGLGAADGMNEHGLAVHMLYLNASDFGARDKALPGVHAGLWAQYALDNAASVPEALELLAKIQVLPVESHGHKTNVHLALDDASGDSAIVEYIDGKPVVHHGRDYRVMTNDPSYDQQLDLLKAQDYSKPSSDTPLPGNVNPRDRFQRASYYLSMVPTPKTEREGVASMLAIMRNVSVPFGAPYKSFGVYNTEYRTVSDPTNKLYFFELTTSPNVIWTDLKGLDFRPGAPVRDLNPDSINLVGDVTRDYARARAPY